ncbi:hypothetical protein [Vibrio coralliilyticus]|uniref:hypothetical protein n=1 Tax=Vibrio coralliilyticus TaxID=190893 RepID=UPI002097B834|nr:hypothetical protein [Vibrio coralliilyticus]USD98931.1 hypothetical protein CTT30_22885 [Vibrio coralliilyticus]
MTYSNVFWSIILSASCTSAFAGFIPTYNPGTGYHFVPKKDEYKDSRFAYSQKKISRTTVLERNIDVDAKLTLIDKNKRGRVDLWWLWIRDGEGLRIAGGNTSIQLCPAASKEQYCWWDAEDIDGTFFLSKRPFKWLLYDSSR